MRLLLQRKNIRTSFSGVLVSLLLSYYSLSFWGYVMAILSFCVVLLVKWEVIGIRYEKLALIFLMYFTFIYGILRNIVGKLRHIGKTVTIGNDTINISYHHQGNEYNLILPYKKEFVSSMTQHKVYLETENEEVDITQQPGIPYLAKANELGGSRYVIVHGDNKRYLDEIPINYWNRRVRPIHAE